MVFWKCLQVGANFSGNLALESCFELPKWTLNECGAQMGNASLSHFPIPFHAPQLYLLFQLDFLNKTFFFFFFAENVCCASLITGLLLRCCQGVLSVFRGNFNGHHIFSIFLAPFVCVCVCLLNSPHHLPWCSLSVNAANRLMLFQPLDLSAQLLDYLSPPVWVLPLAFFMHVYFLSLIEILIPSTCSYRLKKVWRTSV